WIIEKLSRHLQVEDRKLLLPTRELRAMSTCASQAIKCILAPDSGPRENRALCQENLVPHLVTTVRRTNLMHPSLQLSILLLSPAANFRVYMRLKCSHVIR
ncbi:unnamed protein product, partial [Choristocarpus tenellus]